MTLETSPTPLDANEEVAALIETLQATGQRLEELTGGEVDTVSDRDGRTFLLGRAQEQLRRRDAAKQSAILNALPAHIALLDTHGLILSINEAWRQFGRSSVAHGPGYRVGLNYLEICDGAGADAAAAEPRQVADGIRSVLSGQAKSFSIEYACGTPTAQRWFLMTATPLADDRTNGAVVMHLDVTAQRHTEASLRDSESRFRQMADNISDVFFLREADGSRMLYVSPAYEKIWGRNRESLYSNPASWGEAVHPEDQAAMRAKDQQGIRTGKYEMEFRILRPDGSIRWIETKGFPVPDDAGKIVRIAGVAEDITERKLAEEELVETSRQRGMAEVATNVLHNVGNVLNSVNVSASLVTDSIKSAPGASMAKVAALLREHEADLGSYITSDSKGRHIPALLEELAQGWLARQEVVVKELESLRGNIDHIKEIVAMQQSNARVSSVLEMVNVSDLVEDSLRMNASGLVKDHVRIVREFEPVPAVSVEKHKVLQILINLVRNAKHACDGLEAASKRITVRIAQAEGRIRISVSDNGAGIAAENLTRIFSHGFTTRKDGHGFGLHSGALAAAELGGSLSAHSDGPGKGATFTLEFGQRPRGVGA